MRHWHDGRRVSPPHAAALRPQYPVRAERLLLRPLTVQVMLMRFLPTEVGPDVCRYVPFEPMTREVIEANGSRRSGHAGSSPMRGRR